MNCPTYRDDCPDAEWCQQGGSCASARGEAADPVPVRHKFYTGLTIAVLFVAGTAAAITAAVQGSLWWLALPVVAGVLLALTLGRPCRRDEQLARIVDLPDCGVDLSLIDLHRWADAGDDPRWRCDLEDDTGEKR